MFADNSVKEYSRLLASKCAVPGGGGASATVACLGASLASMVCGLTAGKKKYEEYADDILRIAGEAERLREKLLELSDADAAAFEPLSRAYAMPADVPDRDEIMEKCLRDAAAVPMEILRCSCRAISLHNELKDKCSRLAVSDVGTGVVFCWAAMYGAAMNVRVNTHSMKDREYAERLNSEAGELMQEYWQTADKVYESVWEMLK